MNKTPGMKIGTLSTASQLKHWQMMYENRAFNPQGRIVTEKDLFETLQHTPWERYHLTTNQHLGSKKINPVKHLSTKQTEQHKILKAKEVGLIVHAESRKKSPKSKPQEIQHVKYVEEPLPQPMPSEHDRLSPISPDPSESDRTSTVSPSSPEQIFQITRDNSTRPLLRRPLPRGVPIPMDSPMFGEYSTDEWRTFSLTTVCVDDPMDENGFYRTHYPLVLKMIGRRKDKSEMTRSSEMFRPIARTPSRSFSFFDHMHRYVPSPTLSELAVDLSDTDQNHHSDLEDTV